jgi:MFS family permease
VRRAILAAREGVPAHHLRRTTPQLRTRSFRIANSPAVVRNSRKRIDTLDRSARPPTSYVLPIVRARLALFAMFCTYGIVLSTWAVHLPALKQSAGLSNGMLGTVLLVVGIGSLVGMQLCGAIIDRAGGTTIAVVASAALTVSILVPLSASTLWQAIAGAFLLGVAAGCSDVALNSVGVDVERAYGRPILAAFHAMWSVGTVIGTLSGAAGFGLHLTTLAATSIVAAGCLAIVGVAFAGLRSYRPGTTEVIQGTPTTQPPDRRRRRVLVLGMLAFLLLLSEGTAMDWSSMHAQQHFGASASNGAFALGSFVIAMTAARLIIDRIAHAVGPVLVLRVGAALATGGIIAVMAAPNYPVALVGWALFGLGLAGGLPQVFSAAGNLGGSRSGRTLSRVVGVGYLAILAGPALIGWIVDLVSWTGALVVPLFAVVVCALAASAVAQNLDR